MSQPYGIAVGPGPPHLRRRYGRRASFTSTTSRSPATRRSRSTRIRSSASPSSANRMFVTDSASGRLLCLDAKGRTQWVLGPKDGFARPTGIAAAATVCYVVDTLKHRVVVVSLTGAVMATFGARGRRAGPVQLSDQHRPRRGRPPVRDRRDELPRAGLRRDGPLSPDVRPPGRRFRRFRQAEGHRGGQRRPRLRGRRTERRRADLRRRGQAAARLRRVGPWRRPVLAAVRASRSSTTSCTSPTRRTGASRCSSISEGARDAGCPRTRARDRRRNAAASCRAGAGHGHVADQQAQPVERRARGPSSRRR